MDGKTRRLVNKLNDPVLVNRLVEAGFDTPRKIKAASDAALDKAVGVPGRQELRKRFKKVG